MGVVYSISMLSVSGGRPVAPLDDAYIHFQYARQLAQGHPWQYNTGDPYSTGATSLLYPFLLATGIKIGFAGENLVWFSLVVGIITLAVSAAVVADITGRLLQRTTEPETTITRWAPHLTALLFILTGAVQWGYFNSMETGLYALWILLTFNAFLARRYLFASVTVVLAAFTRPEGLFMAGVLWLVVVGQHLHSNRHERRQALLPVTIGLLIGVLPTTLNYALTGSLMATGAQAKSWFQNVPFRFGDILNSVGIGFRLVLEQMTVGFLSNTPWFLIPTFLFLVAAGWFILARKRQWPVVALTGGWFLLGALAAATLITVIWHVGRYQLPYVAILAPVATCGVVAIIERLPAKKAVAVAVTALLLVLGLYQTMLANQLYRQSIYSVMVQQIAMADWIDDHLPADARVSVHDAGVISYLGGRPTYDFIGLTTQGAAAAWRSGIGAVFERMENTPARPTHFATYPNVISIPYLRRTDLFKDELFRVDLASFSPISAAGPTQVIYQADWRLANSGDRLYQEDVAKLVKGKTLVGQIDMGDLSSEAANKLVWWEGLVIPGFQTEVRQMRYRTEPEQEVLDGGRLLTGGMSFEAPVEPGKELLLVARLHPENPGAVEVTANGQSLGQWRYPGLPGEWLESAFLIPAEVVDDETVHIQLDVSGADQPHSRFAPYHLWLWQGKNLPGSEPFEPERSLSARLGDELVLSGYDLDLTANANNKVIPLRLYWQTESATDVDAAVFIHLYDEEGVIVAQQDQRPYLGTRPPYTWSVEEIITDPYRLVLPENLPDGRYQLAAGMYDPESLTRLPVVASKEFLLGDDRILLADLIVKGSSMAEETP